MIDQLQNKQRKLIASIKNIKYLRKEYDILNSDEKLVGLIGARVVGKTTLLLQYLSQYSLDEALYFSADDIPFTLSIVENPE